MPYRQRLVKFELTGSATIDATALSMTFCLLIPMSPLIRICSRLHAMLQPFLAFRSLFLAFDTFTMINFNANFVLHFDASRNTDARFARRRHNIS